MVIILIERNLASINITYRAFSRVILYLANQITPFQGYIILHNPHLYYPGYKQIQILNFFPVKFILFLNYVNFNILVL